MNRIVFENEITLFWDKDWEKDEELEYEIFLDEKSIGNTTKTHYKITDLVPETDYHISVKQKGLSCDTVTYFSETVKTQKPKRRLDVTKAPFFAIGDGKTLNTVAIQSALDVCTADDVIYIPTGVFLCGALNISSNTEIFVEKGAVLQGTADIKDYTPKIKSRFEGTEMMCYRSLLNLGELDRNGDYNCENVIIRGGGTIYGGGKELAENIINYERENLKEFLLKNADYVASCENKDTIPGRTRGRLINMSNCKNVIVSNLTLGFGPAWNVHMIYSRDIITCDCKIESFGVWNGDGWDPDSSENCTVFATEFRTHDDGIAIKSGKNPEGNIVNLPTKNIKIFDCFGRRGIAIGSEVSGGIDGVYIWDCEYKDSIGITVKTTNKRGGYIKNLYVKDSTMASVCVTTKVNYNNDGESAKTVTELKNYNFKNLTLLGEGIGWKGERCFYTPIKIEGFEEPKNFIKNVTVKNIVYKKAEDNNTQNLKITGVKDLKILN